MRIVRMVVWVLLLVALLIFSIANWDARITIRIWEDLVVDTNVPALAIVSFLAGLVPMWLIHRTTKWQMKRRITSLENATRAVSVTPLSDPTPSPAEPSLLGADRPALFTPDEQERIAR